jgi:lipopolysaccharide export system permease protein
MNKILNQYLIINYSKIILNTILIFFALGVILNLFEEIDFFKDSNESLVIPFILSLSIVPTLILELLPFIIFLSSMYFFLYLKSNKDLLNIKVLGYSNLKIISIVAFFAFMFGILVLIVVNPITSSLIKYYETEKAQYSRDVDHLVSINRNGVWIKEVETQGYKIINADNLDDEVLRNVSIYFFDKNNMIIKRIESDTALIMDSPWVLKNAYVYDFVDIENNFFEIYEFETKNNLDRINSLFRNLNILSFIDLINDYDQLNKVGYSKKLLNEQINKFISLPFFLFLMVVLASIFTIGTVNTKQNYYYIILSIFISVIIFYFKDLSIALGQTGKINLILSVWMPLMAISLFCLIGVIQINEK